MITYFPNIYPDELLYSQLSRFYTKSGYLAYIYAAEDLFEKKTVKPNIEFINKFNNNALNIITKQNSIENIINNHTMFPYYSRFLNKERRNNAFSSLINMDENYHNLLCLPKSKNGDHRFIRYCPICTNIDRKKYGETYWHRSHQLIGVDICPIHFCKLKNSTIIISGKSSPSLITAEEIIPYNEKCEICNNKIECNLSLYIYNVFNEKINMNNDIKVGDFFFSKIENTKYVTNRGEKKNVALIHEDFLKYYKDLKNNPLLEKWRLQKVFVNSIYTTYEICMVAMFLNVKENELANMKLPKISQAQLFDNKVKQMYKNGMSYYEISKKLNTSYESIKLIINNKNSTYHYQTNKKERINRKGGIKRKDWNKIDNDMYQIVKETIYRFRHDTTQKPQKITIGLIERILNLPDKTIINCPKCLKEIENNYESQEEFWTRKIVWAINVLKKNNKEINYTNIRKLTNIRKNDFLHCTKHLNINM